MGRMLDLVERLPRRDQEVLALCAWSELTYHEAATVLGVPVGTVRSRLARARARLVELEGNPSAAWTQMGWSSIGLSGKWRRNSD